MTAGALLSGASFAVPQFQREYAWEREDVEEFWSDLRRGLDDDTYFLGLVILTGTEAQKAIVDGQQRLLTLTLLAAALYHEARAADRRALAERIQSTFLRYTDFESDEELPRLSLADQEDNATLAAILANPAASLTSTAQDESVSELLLAAYRILDHRLRLDLAPDRFKRLGLWADFLTNKLYFANFLHPDPSSAYRVFEVVNTRGKILTTADLLKSFVLSQTNEPQRAKRYIEWQQISNHFDAASSGAFVQFIRHAVTVEQGHIPPKDLYDVLANRTRSNKSRVGPDGLMNLLGRSLPLYSQMIDPTIDGPADDEQLGVFSALNRLGVISVRPMLLAISETPDATSGMTQLLRLVVRRIVVGNLGTGNVERRFGNAAQRISEDRSWTDVLAALGDLNPPRSDFVNQLERRSLNKNVLAFVRQSVIQHSVIPQQDGFLQLLRPRLAPQWTPFSDDKASYWASTIGNTYLTVEDRRPKGANTWEGVKKHLLPHGVKNELRTDLEEFASWDEQAVSSTGSRIAQEAAFIWYL